MVELIPEQVIEPKIFMIRDRFLRGFHAFSDKRRDIELITDCDKFKN